MNNMIPPIIHSTVDGSRGACLASLLKKHIIYYNYICYIYTIYSTPFIFIENSSYLLYALPTYTLFVKMIATERVAAFIIIIIAVIPPPFLSSHDTDECALTLHGDVYQSLMLTDIEETFHLLVSGGGCVVTLLAVGGGGSSHSSYGGAGSGHLQHRVSSVSNGTVISVQVGDQGEASTVTIGSGDTVTAQPGQDGQGYAGGAGYCGGGADG